MYGKEYFAAFYAFNGIKLGYRSIRVFFHVFSEILISAFKPAGLINLKVLFLLSFTEPDFPCKVYIAGDKYAVFGVETRGGVVYGDTCWFHINSLKTDLLEDELWSIISGGIGFLVWGDIKTNKFRFKRYSLQTKIVLLTSLVLIVLPAVYFFFAEYADLNMSDRIISSFFQSVTTRTAGFNSQDLSQMNESGTAIMVILMLIGGSPGSTAGGMKTVTIAVLFLSAITVFSRRRDVQGFKRRIADDMVRNAGAILFMYFALTFISGIVISRIEHLPLLTCLFETSSGIGTVGLTLGITPKLALASRAILMVLMFFGRVGGLTLIYAALPSQGSKNSRLPLENISLG